MNIPDPDPAATPMACLLALTHGTDPADFQAAAEVLRDVSTHARSLAYLLECYPQIPPERTGYQIQDASQEAVQLVAALRLLGLDVPHWVPDAGQLPPLDAQTEGGDR